MFRYPKIIEPIEKKKLDNIDYITRVINLYDINELVTYIESACEDEELDFNTRTKSIYFTINI